MTLSRRNVLKIGGAAAAAAAARPQGFLADRTAQGRLHLYRHHQRQWLELRP
nr:twin-arginine translocation signal domain-containing protein [Mesorhizobium sediminum]